MPTSAPPDARPARRRGRPRQFDYDQALDAALQTFWHRGYAATSLDHLTAAMRLNRPSVYAAFGNKEAIYAAAIQRYVAVAGRETLQALARPRLRDALAGFLAAIIDTATGRYGPNGCAICCTLPAEAGHSEAARRQLAEAIAQLDGAIQARLRAAVAARELAAAADVASLAQLVTGVAFSLSIRARAGTPRRELGRIARALVGLVVRGD
ncbi:MAG: TetR/AcrR family transcriptional regulator [Deltaproteobacteria bacterium]|nr:TetR/AcrR family transcriptional regulator [Deltaproteobacteria bacterium]